MPAASASALTAGQQRHLKMLHAMDCWARGSWYNDVPRSRELTKERAFRWQHNNTLFWHVPRTAGCPSFRNYTRDDFCGTLNGRSILMVGDSLTRAFHETLADHLAFTNSHTVQPYCLADGYDATRRCPGHGVCDGRGLLIFRRSDRLDETQTAYSTTSLLHRQEPWVPDMRKSKYDIVILNQGPHFREDAELVTSYRRVIKFLIRENPSALIVVRTTPPGHHDCWSHKKPLTKPQPLAGLPYRWDEFPRQNALVRSMLYHEFPAQTLLLDVVPPTLLRPDMHASAKDCLHYMTPGPVDTWVYLLYNALALHERLSAPTA